MVGSVTNMPPAPPATSTCVSTPTNRPVGESVASVGVTVSWVPRPRILVSNGLASRPAIAGTLFSRALPSALSTLPRTMPSNSPVTWLGMPLTWRSKLSSTTDVLGSDVASLPPAAVTPRLPLMCAAEAVTVIVPLPPMHATL